MLALALLVGPSFAQVAAAEVCPTPCDPLTLATHDCCEEQDAPAAVERVSTQPDDGDGDQGPADKPAHSCPKFCPGCTGRPLALDTPRLTLSLDRAPLVVSAFGAITSASFDVPFAIFHPPRA